MRNGDPMYLSEKGTELVREFQLAAARRDFILTQHTRARLMWYLGDLEVKAALAEIALAALSVRDQLSAPAAAAKHLAVAAVYYALAETPTVETHDPLGHDPGMTDPR